MYDLANRRAPEQARVFEVFALGQTKPAAELLAVAHTPSSRRPRGRCVMGTLINLVFENRRRDEARKVVSHAYAFGDARFEILWFYVLASLARVSLSK